MNKGIIPQLLLEVVKMVVINARWYNGTNCVGEMCYYFYTKKEVRQKSKQSAINDNADYLIIEWMDRTIEYYTRRGTRWFKD